jgi:hypothetical protein
VNQSTTCIFLIQGRQYVVLIVFVDDLLLTGDNNIAWNLGTKLHYTIWNDKHGIHELLHRFGMYLSYLRDTVHIMKLFMENILQVWHAWLSMYGNSYEWRHPTMSTYELRGCGCYVLSTMHGKFHLPHTHTHTHLDITCPWMLLIDLLATLKKFISMQPNMFIDMLKVLLNLRHFSFMKTMPCW